MAMRSPLCRLRAFRSIALAHGDLAGKFKKGGYKDMKTDELLTSMLRATIAKLPVKPEEVQDITVGTVQGKGELLEVWQRWLML
jgi:acetyl-CoA acyltransferase 1